MLADQGKDTPVIKRKLQGFHISRDKKILAHVKSLYQPVFEWLEEYLAQLSEVSAKTVNLDIVYFNSDSSKMRLDFFGFLNEETIVKNVRVAVNWYYEEEDMLEFGEEFQEDFKTLTVQFVKR